MSLPVAGVAAPFDQAPAEDPPAAASVGPASPEPVSPKGADDGRRKSRRLPANLGRGFLGVFSGNNVASLIVGAVATVDAASLDTHVRDAVADPSSGFGKTLSSVGAVPAVMTVTGLFISGRFAHGPRFRAATYDLLDAMIVNAAYTQILKYATQRERPDGSNKHSFPSGHASDAFTLATVVQQHYGWKAGAPAYVIASAIGYSRLLQDKHYLSDVVAGAALGYIVGRTVVRLNGRPLEGVPKTTWNISPIAGRDARGILLTVSF